MPLDAQMLPCWELEENTPPQPPLLLADMHGDGRIVGALALPAARALGTHALPHLGVSVEDAAWLREQVRQGGAAPLLLPAGRMLYRVDPSLYLSTGLVLITRCPVPRRVAAALTHLLGHVICHPTLMSENAPPSETALREGMLTLLPYWHAVSACLPPAGNVTDAPSVADALCRMLRACAALCGCEVEIAAAAPLPPLACGRVSYDLPLCCAVLLLWCMALRRHGARRFAAALQDGGEGIALSLTAQDADEAVVRCEELAFCRTLAARGEQMLDAGMHDGACCLHLCAVRKDFSLLGIKTKPQLG